MDPNQTLLDMYETVKKQDLPTTRELALALKEWFAKGGFYPPQYTPQRMQVYLATVICYTEGHDPEPAFSLICQYCNAGEDIEIRDQALAAGWTNIHSAYAIAQANYCR